MRYDTRAVQGSKTETIWSFPVLLLLVYLLADYGRPAFFAPLRLGIVLIVLLSIYIVRTSGKVLELLKDAYFKLFVLLLADMTLMGFLADNNYWAFYGFLGILTYGIYAVAFCLILDSPKKIRLFLSFYVFVSALTAGFRIFGGAGILGGTSFIGESNDYALALNVVTPIGVYLGASLRGWKRYFLWACTVVIVVANIETFSRGGFVGLAMVGILCWAGSKRKILSGVALLSCSLILFLWMPDGYKKEILTIGPEIHSVKDAGEGRLGIAPEIEYSTGKDRIELWKTAWRMFLDNPILGVGQENLTWKLGMYQFDEKGNTFWQRMVSGRAVHSIYFTVLPELGIVGTLIWVGMIWNLFKKYRFLSKETMPAELRPTDEEGTRILRYCSIGLGIGLAGYLVTGIFLSAFYYPHFWNLAGFLTAAYFTKRRMIGCP